MYTMKSITSLLFLLALLFPFQISANSGISEEDMQEHQSRGRDASCMTFLQKSEVDIPALQNDKRWTKIQEVETNHISFTFFTDAEQPDAPVAVIKSRGVSETGEVLTRITWQVGDKKRTVRLEIPEWVCESPLEGYDGVEHELEGFMLLLLNSFPDDN